MDLHSSGSHIYTFGSSAMDRILLPNAGVSVRVEYWTGSEWVLDPDSPVTEPTTIYTLDVKLRLTGDGRFGFDARGGVRESS